ncbi:unnamed protein product [Schistosoma curassoni]|uniref:Uncharacterized protein n=1 Tax=Schistosoma curassoni TaxID=6186 RepID=A0A183K125_9TREM|nr:unnamed protein product [Schistosoma curassoni]
MVVGGSQRETLGLGFVLLGTRQQGVPVILSELLLPGGLDSSQDLKEHKLNVTNPRRGRNQEEAMEVDRTHIEESSCVTKVSSQMGSSRLKEKRKNKEHITPRNGDRREKNELQLDRTRKEGPEYSGFKNSGRWSMHH